MANDDITIVSSTDSPEEVQAALTGVPVAEAKPAEPEAPAAAAAAVTPPAAAAVPAVVEGEQPPVENETPAQKLEREKGNSRHRRTNRIQSEIDRLTWQKKQAERDAEVEAAKVAAARAELAAIEAQKAVASAKPSGPTTTTAATDVAPKMDDVDEQGRAKYPEYEDWVNANGKWHAEQAAASVRAAAAETEQRLTKKQTDAERDRIAREAVTREAREAYASYDQQLEAFRATTPDFDATYDAAKEFVTELVEERGPDVMNVVERYTVHDADNGPAVTHFLCKNPDEMRRITALPVPQQIAALAKIDARLAAASTAPAQPPAAPVTRAPEPIKPVGSTPTASSVSPEDEPYPVYRARRAREEAIARGVAVPA